MNFLDNSFILLFFHPNITFLKNLKLYLQNLAHSANRKIHLRSLKECTSYGTLVSPRYLCLMTKICRHLTLHGKRDFTNVVKLKTLRWCAYSDSSRDPK